jgi:hypothetical protein
MVFKQTPEKVIVVVMLPSPTSPNHGSATKEGGLTSHGQSSYTQGEGYLVCKYNSSYTTVVFIDV